MNRLSLKESVARFALATGSVALAVSMAAAQTTTTNAPKIPVKPAAVPAKPVAKPAAVKAPAQTAATVTKAPQATVPVVKASSQTALPTTGQTTNSATPAAAVPANYTSGRSAPIQQMAGGSPAGGGRSALTTQGLGTFLWGDGTLTVYSCYRTGTRVLCDFDFTKQNNAQVNAPWVWGGVNMVDDGGKVTAIHNAYFMGQDGTQFQTGYVSTNAVRMIMEYDNVGANFNSVALVFGPNRIQGVPINAVDASQPAGTVPGRGGASTQASGAAPSSGTNPIDGATNAVNNASNTVNNAKQKSKSLWDTLKSATSK